MPPPPSVAPPLPNLLRQILEGKQIENKTIGDFLARNKSLKRYSSGFRLLWPIFQRGDAHPPHANSDQIADAIVQLFHFSPSQARNAYSAVLLLTGVGGFDVPSHARTIKERVEQEFGEMCIFLGPRANPEGPYGIPLSYFG